MIALPFADPEAYAARYAEPDKARTGLGAGPDAWPTPYWTIDASMAVMTLLHAAEAQGLGALFFAVFNGADAVRAELCVPDRLQLLGAIALGHPAAHGRETCRTQRLDVGAGRAEEIIHRGGWRGA